MHKNHKKKKRKKFKKFQLNLFGESIISFLINFSRKGQKFAKSSKFLLQKFP